jgi:hypothetical protein
MTTETDTADDGTEAKSTGAGVGKTIPDADGFDPEAWTVEEIAWAIEAAVLGKPDGAPLTLSQLNSVYAYFTGEFHFHPADYGTDRSPEIGTVRSQVAGQAGFTYDTPEDVDYTDRPYRKAELAALLEAIGETGDKRGWV